MTIKKIEYMVLWTSLVLCLSGCTRLPSERNDSPKTTLITYPAPESETESKDFSMTVNRKPVFASQVRVSADPINQVWPGHQRTKEQTEMASFAYFDCEGVVSIEIESKRPIETITIRPKSAGISHVLKANKITLSLDQLRKFVVEVNGRHHALHIFANAIEKECGDTMPMVLMSSIARM